jgi:Cu-processing system ATP-binding protein
LNTSVIEVQAVAKQFGEIRAVDGVDLAVQEGEVFGLIGHNGAGKSTLMKMMLGLLRPDRGSIRVQGEPVRGPRFRDVRRRIAYLPENVVFYDNLSGLETLRFFAELKGAPTRGCQALLEKVGIAHAAGRPVRGYSKGMRQRLGFAQALLGEPRLLFLDEPTAGMGTQGAGRLAELIRALRRRTTIVVIEHDMPFLFGLADRVHVIHWGQVIAQGTPEELRRDSWVARSNLGQMTPQVH